MVTIVVYGIYILSFYNYNFTRKNTLIIIKWEQAQKWKMIKEIYEIYEIYYTGKCHSEWHLARLEHLIANQLEDVKMAAAARAKQREQCAA